MFTLSISAGFDSPCIRTAPADSLHSLIANYREARDHYERFQKRVSALGKLWGEPASGTEGFRKMTRLEEQLSEVIGEMCNAERRLIKALGAMSLKGVVSDGILFAVIYLEEEDQHRLTVIDLDAVMGLEKSA